MKFSQRLLCALCAFTLLFGCFSFTAKAVQVEDFSVRMFSELYLDSPFDGMWTSTPIVSTTMYSGQTREPDTFPMKDLDVSGWTETYLYVYYRYSFTTNSSKPLFEGGQTYNFKVTGLQSSLKFIDPTVIYNGVQVITDANSDTQLTHAYLLYMDGGSQSITELASHKVNTYDKTGGFDAYNFTPKSDVRSIVFVAKSPSVGFEQEVRSAEISTGALDLYIDIDDVDNTEEETLGFFERILKKVQAFRDDVKNSLNSSSEERRGMWQTLKDTLTKITEMPQRIWSYIKNGLQSLFIPDEAFMKQWVEKNRQWCTETFGALYQSFDLIINAYTNIDASAETHYIDVPIVKIPLPDNQQFTFGGYHVRIVPQGFEYIASVCKAVVGIICTFAFINGMRRRYDDIMEETK